MSAIAFVILGRPQSAGSKRAFAKKGGGVAVAPDNPLQKGWQADVRAAAGQALADQRATSNGDGAVLDGPLRLDVAFFLRRPANHYGTGRNEGRLKASAPIRPDRKPDVSKLLRALEDGLTGQVIADDARFVTVCAEKHYGTPERAEVIVTELGQTTLAVP
jgi:crossover junction endodeoxyribonuclease RusA